MAHRSKNESRVRSRVFAMRVNEAERRMLEALAKRLRRSRSDTVRLLVREALSQLSLMEEEDGRSEVTPAGKEADYA